METKEFEETFKNRFSGFSAEVCEKRRFFFSAESRMFLDDLYDYLVADKQNRQSSKKTVEQGTSFYRARVHKFNSDSNGYVVSAFKSEDMKPVPNMRSYGRLNAYNINALYLANDPKTALSEVRPPAGAPVSVAEFKAIRQLTILKLSFVATNWFDYLVPGPTFALANRFAQPLDHQDHQAREYIPTQVLAEYLHSRGIDGIEYPSQFLAIDFDEFTVKQSKKAEVTDAKEKNYDLKQVLNEARGTNLCLFDLNDAECQPDSIEVLCLKKRINLVSKYEPPKDNLKL